tara:strand:- start:8859 stop:10274 length:1416 start_codon:yes stop_codon:yes gene_type:complete
MIDETITTAPRISTDIQVDPVQIDTSFQDISSELAELQKQVEEFQQRRQDLINRSEKGLGSFAPQSAFTFSDPDFGGGIQYNINDLDKLIQPRLDRIEFLKKLQKTKIDEANITPAPIRPFDVTQEELNDLNTTKTGAEKDDTTDVVSASGEDTQDDNTGAGVPDGTTTDIEEEVPFFGGEKFLNFIRNVGQSLVTEQNMGSGLAVGAAKAAEEEAKRQLLEKQQAAEILKSQIENLGIEPKDAKTATEINKNISNTIRDYDNTNRNIARVDEAIYYLKNDPRTAGGIGFLGFLGKIKDQLFSFAGVNSATSFDQLEPRTKVDAILNVLQQEGIREILGEAGRAISNLDRQIVQEVFGNITITTSLAEILKKLEDSRDRFIKAQDQRRTDMIADTGFFQSSRIPSSVMQTNVDKIKEIITYQPPKTSTFIPEAGGEEIAGEVNLYSQSSAPIKSPTEVAKDAFLSDFLGDD